jgi:hypothetical protein
VDDPDPSVAELQVSEVNPAARRRPGGIWCEDILPVLEWECAEHRVVLPEELQRALGLSSPVLRWSSIKYRAIAESHARDRTIVHELTRYLSNWSFIGEEPEPHAGQYRVLFHDDRGRWYALTLGIDRNGSHNVITIFGGSDSGFLRNRLRRLVNVVKREK